MLQLQNHEHEHRGEDGGDVELSSDQETGGGNGPGCGRRRQTTRRPHPASPDHAGAHEAHANGNSCNDLAAGAREQIHGERGKGRGARRNDGDGPLTRRRAAQLSFEPDGEPEGRGERHTPEDRELQVDMAHGRRLAHGSGPLP